MNVSELRQIACAACNGTGLQRFGGTGLVRCSYCKCTQRTDDPQALSILPGCGGGCEKEKGS